MISRNNSLRFGNLRGSGIRRFLLFLILLVSGVARVSANEAEDDVYSLKRPVMGSYRLELGRRSDYSSYLSPFSYRGTTFALSGFWTKSLPSNPRHLAMQFEGRTNFASLLNPAGSARELDWHAHFTWGLLWQKRFSGNWMIGAGGNVGVYGGVVYLPRNGNNPASAQFAVGIGASFFASRLFFIKSLPLLVSDRISLPLAGGFFCQDYGESYYEIYLGNREKLAHFGYPGNRFGIDNLLSVTLDLGRTALEIGYRFSMQNEQANNLTTRFFSNAFVIGVIPGGLGIKTGRKDIITPLY